MYWPSQKDMEIFVDVKPLPVPIVYKSLQDFVASFEMEKGSSRWYTNDHRIMFRRFQNRWNWLAQAVDFKEEKLVQNLGLQTTGFKRLKDAVQYVEAVFPWVDVSKISIEKRTFVNADRVTLIQEQKGWLALHRGCVIKDQTKNQINASSHLKLLSAIWEKLAIDGELTLKV